MRCRHYQIRLNPHKCVFCIETSCLLGFVVSKASIRVDPSKVEAIVKLPPPSTLRLLQSLEGKENFLHRFIPNYAEITKGFTWLLKQNTPFFWDEIADKSFDALKHALTHAPLLHPPNYNQDYFLYLAASHSTIGMVLVQQDEFESEHVIYYLSWNLTPIELKYSHVEKLALAAVQAFQRFRHYILLRKTTVISDRNPMQYILMHAPPAPLHPIIAVGPFAKWGIDFITCNPHSAGGHAYIILAMSTPLQTYIGFADGTCRSTRNISFAAWVIYSPSDELVSMHGVSLGRTTNNIAEFSAVIELLSESISFGIQNLIVNLDLELIVLQLNRVYAIRNPVLLQLFFRVCLLEREFDYIEYQHIPRYLNTLADAVASRILNRHLH
eukprot:PITA_21936